MELEILNTCLASRESFSKIIQYINPDKYSKEFRYLIGFITDYYKRDRDASSVHLSVLKQLIGEVIDNDKHVDRFVEILDSAAGIATSAPNVTATIIQAKEHELAIELATTLANGEKGEKLDRIYEAFGKVRAASSLQDIEEGEGSEVIENIDVSALIQGRLTRGNLLPLYPTSLNARLDGGLEGGDHVVLYGLTEIGKSAFSINAACGFAYSGFSGLYLINEDKTSRIAQRFVSNLSGMDKYQQQQRPDEAQRKANERGLGCIRVIGLTPGSPRQIEALVERYDPKWVVIDQLRNLNTGTRNNRVVQLEEAASSVRNIGKAANIVVISVTQASDSARNKIFLDTGDVDFSNVGIPGAADVMIGFGADEAMLKNNERGISLAKNKISGDHSQFVTRIVPQLSQIRDV